MPSDGGEGAVLCLSRASVVVEEEKISAIENLKIFSHFVAVYYIYYTMYSITVI